MEGNMIFAKRIKKLRETRGESQEDLAKLVGYKKQAISHWEINGKIPRTRALEIIAKHYETTSDYLLGINSERKPMAEEMNISPDELVLLTLYRRMEENQKDMIHNVAETIVPFHTDKDCK